MSVYNVIRIGSAARDLRSSPTRNIFRPCEGGADELPRLACAHDLMLHFSARLCGVCRRRTGELAFPSERDAAPSRPLMRRKARSAFTVDVPSGLSER